MDIELECKTCGYVSATSVWDDRRHICPVCPVQTDMATEVPNASSAVVAEYNELLATYPDALQSRVPLFAAAYAAEIVVSEDSSCWYMAPAYAPTWIPE